MPANVAVDPVDGVTVGVIVCVGLLDIVGVTVRVVVGVTVTIAEVTDCVTVLVGVNVAVGVIAIVGVTVILGVTVGVTVLLTVAVGVGVGGARPILYLNPLIICRFHNLAMIFFIVDFYYEYVGVIFLIAPLAGEPSKKNITQIA